MFPPPVSLSDEMSQVSVLLFVCIISKLSTQPGCHGSAEGASAKHLPTHITTPVTASNMRDKTGSRDENTRNVHTMTLQNLFVWPLYGTKANRKTAI